MTDLVGNPAEGNDGTSQANPSDASAGPINQSGEASQSAAGSETFIPQGIDLNTLPPNVRQYIEKVNNDMVRGFTEKTTKLSETIKSESAKAAEAYRQKAELYDQFATQPEFVDKWNEYVQRLQQTPESQQAGDPALMQMREQLQEINAKIQLSEMSQVTDAFAEAVDEKGQKVHADFDELNSIQMGSLDVGGGVEEFSLLRACVELAQGQNPQEKLANGYQKAKELHDSIFEAGRKAGMGRLQAKALNGTNPPSHSSGDVLTVTEKKPKNAHEALAMAKRGQVVSRE